MLISTILDNQPLVERAQQFNAQGIVAQENAYTFLNIGDEYIHELFNLLDPAYNAQKPNYFSAEKASGAHITIVYNEENVQLDPKEMGVRHSFSVTDLYKVLLGNKEYFVLMITSPSLTTLRTKYGLPEKPKYKGHSIDFHITIGVKAN